MCFEFKIKALLGDTNAVGNVYFAKYIDWQGKAREILFNSIFGAESLNIMSKYKMITKEVSHKYIEEVLPFEDIVIKIKVDNNKLTTILNFIFYKNDKVIGRGFQKLAFYDLENKVFIKLNDILKK